MFGELGEINMKGRGKRALLTFCGILAFFFLTISSYGQYSFYYIASYGNSLDESDIITVF